MRNEEEHNRQERIQFYKVKMEAWRYPERVPSKTTIRRWRREFEAQGRDKP